VEAKKTVFTGLDADVRLLQLGLSLKPLLRVAEVSYHTFISFSPNYPRFAAGIGGWADGVRELRDYTLPLGYRSSDENNYCVVINDALKLAIQVAMGDSDTGIASGDPSTKALKGLHTMLAVAQNARQYPLWGADQDEKDRMRQPGAKERANPADGVSTWILLMIRDELEVRAELSLPDSVTDDGRINGWRERIILGSIPTGSTKVEVAVPSGPDIDVQVARRKA
jgi:hypothetical protein